MATVSTIGFTLLVFRNMQGRVPGILIDIFMLGVATVAIVGVFVSHESAVRQFMDSFLGFIFAWQGFAGLRYSAAVRRSKK
jgi:hypothetical protein